MKKTLGLLFVLGLSVLTIWAVTRDTKEPKYVEDETEGIFD